MTWTVPGSCTWSTRLSLVDMLAILGCSWLLCLPALEVLADLFALNLFGTGCSTARSYGLLRYSYSVWKNMGLLRSERLQSEHMDLLPSSASAWRSRTFLHLGIHRLWLGHTCVLLILWECGWDYYILRFAVCRYGMVAFFCRCVVDCGILVFSGFALEACGHCLPLIHGAGV